MLQQSGLKQHQVPAKNAVAALKAGTTLLLFVTDHGSPQSSIEIDSLVSGIASAVENGELSENIIDQNLEQVLMVRSKLQSMR